MEHHDKIRSFDATASALAFPLGGIGTGNVSLDSRGELRNWEIFNRPAKGASLPHTFFAIRTQPTGQEPTMRVLEGPIQTPHVLSHGYHPMTGAGLPRFENTIFRGEYPFASIVFEDQDLPIAVELEAYTPLIPLKPEDSGIPCAILTYNVTNVIDDPVAITLVGTLTNPVGNYQFDPFANKASVEFGRSVNTFRNENGVRGLFMTNDQIASTAINFGNLGLITDHEHVTMKRTWLRGEWWDYLHEFWDDCLSDGLLTDPDNDEPGDRLATGSLGLVDSLEPGENKAFRFILTWFFPNRPNTWDMRLLPQLSVDEMDVGITRNHYATRFDDAWDVGRYICKHMSQLETETRRFHDALFGSTLPSVVLDAISANIVPLRSTTCFWLEDGRFYGWEGCNDDYGCCPGNCTHVWSYAYTVAFLFPSLEREMRRIEFNIETGEDGFMPFRSFGTFHRKFVWTGRTDAAVDGQMGSILRAYREWQLSGDNDFLDEIWPGIKRAIDFASAHWDTNNDYVLDGRQHNTYDIEFHGPNPLCGIYYLAALRAVEEIAKIKGEEDLSQRCRQAFETGSQNLDSMLWNGEYYVQRLDNMNAHKYQHGNGCLSDQLLGQLHARILGLGDLLPTDHIRSAVKSIFDNNFKEDFKKRVNCQRAYALNDEAGLLLCTWPEGGRPSLPFPYADEVWTGIEYQVAAHLIYEGWVNEGIQLVGAARARHDGVRRNPWNEVECGNHYARSMSSWALLLALTGMHADPVSGELNFSPASELLSRGKPFKAFWSNGRAWGTYTQTWDEAANTWRPAIEILGGDLEDVSVRAIGNS